MADTGRKSSQRKVLVPEKEGSNLAGDADDLAQAKNPDATVRFVLQIIEGVSIRC